MSTPNTWIAEDLTTPQQRGRRLAVWLGVVAGLLLVAAVLFLATGPPRPAVERREPGVHGQLDTVDLLPGYEVDEEHRHLGPARVALHGGRAVFIPARTPYTGARPCGVLRPPEDAGDAPCSVFVWLGEDGRSATWVTVLRPGGPGESLLDGRLVTASDERLVLDDGTTVLVGPGTRVAECDDRPLADLAGQRVVVSIDDASGSVRQVTCRA